MTLSINLNGIDYDGWGEAFISRNIETAASEFGFATTAKNDELIPIREGDLVTIFVDGIKVLTGYVDLYDIKYNHISHNIVIKGRSITQDFVDSTVPGLKEWKKYSLLKLCTILANNFEIKVIDNANAKDEIFQDIVSAEIGETCFNFMEKFLRRRQILLTDNAEGNLVLTKPNLTLSKYTLKNVIGGKDNNIKSGSRKINLANLFGVYIAQIQEYPLYVDNFADMKELIKISKFIIDPEIRATRIYEFITEENLTLTNFDQDTNLKQRAQWEIGIRRARNFNYSATIAGHSFNNELFVNNMLYQIDDDFTQIHDQFFCNKIRYEYNLNSGSTTTLNFTNKNSYTLQSERDKLFIN